MEEKSKTGNPCKSGIKTWPVDDRPREKLLRNGEHSLSNSELLAILLRTGVKGESAVDLSRKVLSKFKSFRNMSHTDIRDWSEFKGLGHAKIAQIKAAIEIGRRFCEDETREERQKIQSSKDVVKILMPRMRDLKKEIFKVVYMDSQNRVIDIVDSANGTVNHAYPIIREIFQHALQLFATNIICIHNHPSGDIQPSKDDQRFTEELSQAGKIMQISVRDHIIIGDNRYYSFADEGNVFN
ncbi:DNA repair protein RadC [PVC group bacterium]|nr:DNA repair protein RadC [PVC group bacterium]